MTYYHNITADIIYPLVWIKFDIAFRGGLRERP